MSVFLLTFLWFHHRAPDTTIEVYGRSDGEQITLNDLRAVEEAQCRNQSYRGWVYAHPFDQEFPSSGMNCAKVKRPTKRQRELMKDMAF